MLNLIDIAALIVAALQVGDMVTTLMAMSRGAHEANPLVAGAIRLMGRVGGLAFAKSLGIFFTAWLWWMGAHVILWVLAYVYAWVCSHNLEVYRRRGRLIEMNAMYARLAALEAATGADAVPEPAATVAPAPDKPAEPALTP